MKKLLCALALAAAAITPAAASDPGPFKAPGTIVFCTELGDPPAAFVKSDGVTPTGFEYDLMLALGETMGVKTEIKNFKFTTIFAAMESGQCDAVMSQASKNPDRLKLYDFVDYRQQASGILVPKGNPQGIHTYDDISGKRVAVLLGSANERRLKEANDRLAAAGKPPMIIATYQNNAIAFRELDLGRVDAFASGSLVLSYFMHESGGKFEIGGLPIKPATLGIVISKSQPEKTAAIRAAFAEIVANGKAQKIVDDWGVAEGTSLCTPTHACD